MSRRLLTLLSVLALAIAVLSPVAAGAQSSDTTNTANDYQIVTLTGSPAAHDDTTKVNGRFDPDSKGYQQALARMERQHAKFAERLAKTAPDAEIVEHYYVTANAVAIQLNGSDMSSISRIAGVEKTTTSDLYQMDMDQSVNLIRANEVWSGLGGQADAGAGIKVGVIDSGIFDLRWAGLPVYHDFFECKTVNFGGVFYSGETGTPAPDFLPWSDGTVDKPGNDPAPGVLFVSPHGTHVAGTIGGCVTTIDSGPWDGTTLSGVAPGVELWDYNVFPGIGAGWVAFGGSAFSHDIAAAIEQSVADGMDVINMSLGGTVQGPHDFLAETSNAAVAAGVVVVTSAGNEGPGPYTVGSPGSAEDVISVGATTNTRGMAVTITDEAGPEYIAVPGEFPNFDGSTYTIVDWTGTDNEACSADGVGDHAGEVVVIARGACTFSQKVANAKAAGAEGAIIYTYPEQDPIGMARSAGFDDELPAVMVTRADGVALEAGAIAVITPPTSVPTTPNEIAAFSSRGPAPFTGIVKPDVLAPGVNILSSVYPNGWELFNGTSMASPHVAGAAALVLADESSLSPADVKSVLATTATDLDYSVWTQGGGLIDLVAALAADTYFAPTNASFGVWQGKKPVNDSVEISISGSGGCSVSDITGEYVSAEVDGDTLTIDFTGGRDVGTGMHSGSVALSCGGQTYAVPWGIVVDRKG